MTDAEIADYMGDRSRYGLRYGTMKRLKLNPWGETLEQRITRAREELTALKNK